MAEEGGAPAGVSIPAENRGGFSLEELNRELRRTDRDRARRIVRAVVESAILDRFLEAPRGVLPIGILGRENEARLGAETHLVHLPEHIVHKQKGEWEKTRPDGSPRYQGHRLTLREYRLLPDFIERPRLVMRLRPAWPPLTAERLGLRLNLVSEEAGIYYNVVVGRYPDDAAKAALISFHRLGRGRPQLRAMIEQADTGVGNQKVFYDSFGFE